MGNQTLSVTDEIYNELVDGLKTGLDWTHFLAKHASSKGPLYNAIGRFFHDMEGKVRELNEVQAKLDQAGLKLKEQHRMIKEADEAMRDKSHDLEALEKEGNKLRKENEALEAQLEHKAMLVKTLQELEKLGLGKERLEALHTALVAIGAKRGLKRKDSVEAFFADINDYEAMVGFKREIERLEAIAEVKRLEAEKWQAQVEAESRRYKDQAEAISAVQKLTKHGVKTEDIVRWNRVVGKVGGSEQLEQELQNYRSMSELLSGKKSEIEKCEEEVRRLRAQVKALSEQRQDIEESIKTLSLSGVKEIAEVSHRAVAELRSLSSRGLKEINEVVKGGLKPLLAEVVSEMKKLADVEAEAGRLEKELMYARYLTATDEAVLKAFPKEVVLSFLERAAYYCKLNNLNYRVKMPDLMYAKYYNERSPVLLPRLEVDLVDLLSWAEVGLAGASK